MQDSNLPVNQLTRKFVTFFEPPSEPMDGLLFIPSTLLGFLCAGLGILLGIAGLLQQGCRRELPIVGLFMSVVPGLLHFIGCSISGAVICSATYVPREGGDSH